MKRSYPYAKTDDTKDVYFGTVVSDPYRWMEDAKSPETLAFTAAENQYTDEWFARASKTGTLKLEEFVDRQRKASDTRFFQSPVKREDGYYAVMSHQGSCSFVHTDAAFGRERTLLDRQILGGNMNIYEAVPSPSDPELFAVFVLKDGAPRPSVLIYHVKTGQIEACLDYCFSFCWSEDGSRLIYADALLDRENNRNINRVCAWSLESGRSEVIYRYEQNSVFIEVTAAPEGGIYAEVRLTYGDGLLLYIDKDNKSTELTGGKGASSYIGEIGENCYFLTDLHAPLGRLVCLPKSERTKPLAMQEQAVTVLPESDALLCGCAIDGERIYAAFQKDAVSELSCFGPDGGKLFDIRLPDAYGNLTAPKRMIPDGHRLFLEFESFLMPRSILELNTLTGEICTRYMEKDPGDVSDLEVRRQFITARDGCKILAYLVCPKSWKQPRPVPVLMYGYGGYAASTMPWSQDMVTGTDIVGWARQGRMYVHCIIRGGSEYGSGWHEAGMLREKKHVFEDFIDITLWLIEQGWTKPELITATGLSNGGLLMTAVATMRPDLFGTVIASVPHTDMLRFCQDDRGPMYITEYGNPMEKDMFSYLYSYSPYHNIREGVRYPAMYIQTGECDNNVPPYHGKKFAARLQKEASPERPVLLRVLPEGSHDRGSGEYCYRTTAEMQMFIEEGLQRV